MMKLAKKLSIRVFGTIIFALGLASCSVNTTSRHYLVASSAPMPASLSIATVNDARISPSVTIVIDTKSKAGVVGYQPINVANRFYAYPSSGTVWTSEAHWLPLSPPTILCTRFVDSINQECYFSLH